jgi:hypothetical protein
LEAAALRWKENKTKKLLEKEIFAGDSTVP